MIIDNSTSWILEIKKQLKILRIISDAPNSGHKWYIIIHDSSKLSKFPRLCKHKFVSNKNKLCSKWMFPKIVVPPKLSIFIGFSIMNHPFWGTTIFGNTQMEFLQTSVCTWIITIEEQIESRLVRLPAWSRRSAKASGRVIVFWKLETWKGPWFSRTK